MKHHTDIPSGRHSVTLIAAAYSRQITNRQKDVVGNLMVNPLKWLSVGGSFIRGTGHAIADSEYTGIKAGENYAKKRWSAGGVVTTSTFNLRTEYLAGKDRSVKSEGFYATGSVRFARNYGIIIRIGTLIMRLFSVKFRKMPPGLFTAFFHRFKVIIYNHFVL